MFALQNFITRNLFFKPVALTGIILSSIRIQSNMSSVTFPTYVPGESSIAYVTTPNEESARKISRELVSRKLCACVNIIPNIQSIYEWEGKINEDLEYLLMIKTTTDKIEALTTWVRENHPYSVAEVISVKIENGNPPYLDWIKKTVGKP